MKQVDELVNSNWWIIQRETDFNLPFHKNIRVTLLISSVLEVMCKMGSLHVNSRDKSSRVEIFQQLCPVRRTRQIIYSKHCVRQQNMSLSLWSNNEYPMNIITKFHLWNLRKIKPRLPSMQVVLFTWISLNLAPVSTQHCNNENFETIVKQSLEQKGIFAAVWKC